MIDYAKYENASEKVLASAFARAKIQEQKLQEKLRENNEFMRFLSSKISKEYYTLDELSANETLDKWAKANPKEAKEAEKEAMQEMGLL